MAYKIIVSPRAQMEIENATFCFHNKRNPNKDLDINPT